NTNLLLTAGRLRFGSLQSGAGFFNGNLDDIRFYNRVLGSNEVSALYGDSAFAAVPPTNLLASPGNNQVCLTWPAVPIVSGYDLKRSTAPAGPFSSLTTLFATTYTDNAVTNGTTYYYVVDAMNSLGEGPDSPIASVTPSLTASLKAWF